MIVSQTRPAALPAELLDLITEAVARRETAVGRADVITAMLVGALDAVTWRQGPGGDPGEQSSLLRVVEAVVDHHDRMAAAADGPSSEFGR